MSDKLSELAAKIAEWAASPEGKAELAATEARARTSGQRVLADAKCTPEQLRVPVSPPTIHGWEVGKNGWTEDDEATREDI